MYYFVVQVPTNSPILTVRQPAGALGKLNYQRLTAASRPPDVACRVAGNFNFQLAVLQHSNLKYIPKPKYPYFPQLPNLQFPHPWLVAKEPQFLTHICISICFTNAVHTARAVRSSLFQSAVFLGPRILIISVMSQQYSYWLLVDRAREVERGHS